MVGTIRSRNSTTVTCAPRRPHTEPISSPMYLQFTHRMISA